MPEQAHSLRTHCQTFRRQRAPTTVIRMPAILGDVGRSSLRATATRDDQTGIVGWIRLAFAAISDAGRSCWSPEKLPPPKSRPRMCVRGSSSQSCVCLAPPLPTNEHTGRQITWPCKLVAQEECRIGYRDGKQAEKC